MIYLRSLMLLALCVASALAQSPGYTNAARINAAAYKVFGSDLPTSFVSTSGYSHNKGDWPGTVWDFSGCPLAIVNGGSTYSRYTGALITPRHLLVAHHTIGDLPVGADVVFVTPGGSNVTKDITARSDKIGSDLAILTLDSQPSGCAVYKIPTAETSSLLIGSTIWCIDLPRTLVTRRVTAITSGNLLHATDSSGGTIVSGDSGQPAFTTVAGQLVLLGAHHGTTAFPLTSQHIAAINDFCDDVGQSVQTISIDPSTWEEPLGPINLP